MPHNRLDILYGMTGKACVGSTGDGDPCPDHPLGHVWALPAVKACEGSTGDGDLYPDHPLGSHILETDHADSGHAACRMQGCNSPEP